jgi:hypothetical protein
VCRRRCNVAVSRGHCAVKVPLPFEAQLEQAMRVGTCGPTTASSCPMRSDKRSRRGRCRPTSAGSSPRSGCPRTRFHDLRQAHATQLLAAGEHPKAVSERLGHISRVHDGMRFLPEAGSATGGGVGRRTPGKAGFAGPLGTRGSSRSTSRPPDQLADIVPGPARLRKEIGRDLVEPCGIVAALPPGTDPAPHVSAVPHGGRWSSRGTASP